MVLYPPMQKSLEAEEREKKCQGGKTTTKLKQTPADKKRGDKKEEKSTKPLLSS